MNVYGQIAQAIRSIAGVQTGSATIFPAVVKQTDGSTCTILIGDLEVSDVRLRAVINNEQDQLVCTPKQNSQVLVADMSGGEFRELVVIAYSEIETIDLTIGQTTLQLEDGKITINGGNLGGLVKIQELTDKLNNLIDWCKNHTHSGVITAVSGGSGAPAVGTTGNTAAPTSAPTDFNKSDYEDTAVKH